MGFSRTVAGLFGTALALGAVVSGLTNTGLVRRLGRPRTIWLGIAVACAGVALFVAPGVPVGITIAGTFLCGLGGSYVINTANALLASAHGDAAPAALSESQACVATTGVIAPVVISGCVAAGFGWRPGMAAFFIAAAAVWMFDRFSGSSGRREAGTVTDHPGEPGGAPEHQEHEDIISIAPEVAAVADTAHVHAGGSLPRRFWWVWTALTAMIGMEFAITLWASDLLREQTDLSDGAIVGVFSSVVAGVAIIRWLGPALSSRASVDALLLSGIVVYLAGFFVFWTAGSAAPSVVGLLLVGLGLGLLYPLTISKAIEASEGRPDAAAAACALGAGLASGVAPIILGRLADDVGIRTAFLCIPVLCLVASGSLLVSRTPTKVPTSVQ